MNKPDREKLRAVTELLCTYPDQEAWPTLFEDQDQAVRDFLEELHPLAIRALLDLVDGLEGKCADYLAHETEFQYKAFKAYSHQRKRAEAWRLAANSYGTMQTAAIEHARNLDKEGGE